MQYLQAAFYTDGLAALLDLNSLSNITFTNIAIEKAPRPDVVCYGMPQELIAHGRAKYIGWLNRYVGCKDLGMWPGIADNGPLVTEVPRWAEDDVERDAVWT